MSKHVDINGAMVTVPGVYHEIDTGHGPVKILFHDSVPPGEVRMVQPKDLKQLSESLFSPNRKRCEMYVPFNYPFGGSDDDEDDVDEKTKLKEKIADLEKTVQRLSKLTNIPPDKSVFVLKLPPGEGWSNDDHQALLKHLPPTAILVAMPDDYTLEGLDDKDLADLGLKRDNGAGLSEQQRYDAMLMGFRK